MSERKCNRHADCGAAERAEMQQHPERNDFRDFHCHDETCEVVGYHAETKVTIAAIELDSETLRMLAALQSGGELVISVSRRQGVLFKAPGTGAGKDAH